jgi:succinate dehydrogenase/fumarate reductase flavoprotein subunit
VAECAQLAAANVNQRTKNFAQLARLMAEAALWREESRGGHYREDFPARDDPRWRVHSAQQINLPTTSVAQISSNV